MKYIYEGPQLDSKYKELPFYDINKNLSLGGVLKARLKDISDGDTAVFEINEKEEHVRLFVINTPEYNRFGREPWGKQAKDYTISILKGAKEILLQSDPNGDLRDDTMFGRLLAWVWVDGQLLNYNLVKRGYANAKYIENDKLLYLKDLLAAQEYARKKRLKIYGEKDPLWPEGQ
jgi:micrococcal nuclease